MPTAPVYKSQVPIEQAVRTPLQNTNVSPSSFGAGVGKGLEDLGSGLAHLEKVMAQEKEKADISYETGLQAKVEINRQKILKDFGKLKGDEVRGASDKFNKDYQGFVLETSKSIKDPRRQANFLATNMAGAAALNTHLTGSEDSQALAIDNGNHDIAINGARENLSIAYKSGDRALIDEATVSLYDMVDRKGKTNRSSQEMIDAASGEYLSKTSLNSVNEAIAGGDPNLAQRIFDDATFTSQDRIQATGLIQEQKSKIEIVSGGDELYKKFIPKTTKTVDVLNSKEAIVKWGEEATVNGDQYARSKAQNALVKLDSAHGLALAEQQAELNQLMSDHRAGKAVIPPAWMDETAKSTFIHYINNPSEIIIDGPYRRTRGALTRRMDVAKTPEAFNAIKADARALQEAGKLNYDDVDRIFSRSDTMLKELDSKAPKSSETTIKDSLIRGYVNSKGNVKLSDPERDAIEQFVVNGFFNGTFTKDTNPQAAYKTGQELTRSMAAYAPGWIQPDIPLTGFEIMKMELDPITAAGKIFNERLNILANARTDTKEFQVYASVVKKLSEDTSPNAGVKFYSALGSIVPDMGVFTTDLAAEKGVSVSMLSKSDIMNAAMNEKIKREKVYEAGVVKDVYPGQTIYIPGRNKP